MRKKTMVRGRRSDQAPGMSVMLIQLLQVGKEWTVPAELSSILVAGKAGVNRATLKVSTKH